MNSILPLARFLRSLAYRQTVIRHVTLLVVRRLPTAGRFMMTNRATGRPGAHTLFGSAGLDAIGAGPGDDWIIGGQGNDTLIGGPSSDIFVVDRPDGLDLIADDDPAVDRIQVLNAPDQPPAALWGTARAGGSIYMSLQGGNGLNAKCVPER
jgi:hypothetical protein